MDLVAPFLWPVAFLLVCLVCAREIHKMGPTNLDALKVWFGGALGAFCDGFVEGLPAGGIAGGTLGAVDGKISTTTEAANIGILAMHIFAVPVLNGAADVKAWKKDPANRFPNIFAPRAQSVSALTTEPPKQ